MAVPGLLSLLLVLQIFSRITSGTVVTSCASCHGDAVCLESGKPELSCVCSKGFVGDGLTCYNTKLCSDSSCCGKGYHWSPERGCVDTDECFLPESPCAPHQLCHNTRGSFECLTQSSHFSSDVVPMSTGVSFSCGDVVCPPGWDCLEDAEILSCFDPCLHHTALDEDWRSTNNTARDPLHCDDSFTGQGWYRLLLNNTNARIPEYCVPEYRCGTHAPMWLTGPHPTASGEIVERTVGSTWKGECSHFGTINIRVKLCYGDYYIYKLVQPPTCFLAYCAESMNTTPTTDSTTTTTGPSTTATTSPTTTTPRPETTTLTTGSTTTATTSPTTTTTPRPETTTMTTGSTTTATTSPTTTTPRPETTTMTTGSTTTATTSPTTTTPRPETTTLTTGSTTTATSPTTTTPRPETTTMTTGSTTTATTSLTTTTPRPETTTSSTPDTTGPNTTVPLPPLEDFQLICGLATIQIGVNEVEMNSLMLDPFSGNLAVYYCNGHTESNGTVWYEVETIEGACGNILTTNATHIIYSNSLFIYPHSNASFNIPVDFPFSCAFPLETDASLDVALKPFLDLSGSISGAGDKAQAIMNLYYNSSYTDKYPSGLVTLPVGSPLYVGVTVEKKDPRFVAVLEDCHATYSPNPEDTVRYNLIVNQCPADKKLVSVTQSGTSLQARFTALFFLFQHNYNEIYLHCSLSLCDQTSSSCVPGCINRAKRAVFSSEPLEPVTIGPITWGKTSE